MAYDIDLVERIREVIATESGLSERRMFGGLAFLLDGHMTVAASGRGGLMARVDPDDQGDLLMDPHVSPMVMAGKERRGWVRVEMEALSTQRSLTTWVNRSVRFERTLPPKGR